MDDKEVFNPQSGERIAPKKPKKFWKDWRFYVYTIIAVMLAIVSVSSMVTACAAINAGVGQRESASSQYKVKHNAQITTTNGGYIGYRFGVNPPYSSQTIANGYGLYNVYSVDRTTYNLTNIRYNQTFTCADRADFDDAVDYIVSNNGGNSNNELRFLSCFGKNAAGLNMYYFSFITPPNHAMNEIGSRCFLLTNIPSTARVATFGHGQLGPVGQSNLYLINGGQTKTYIYDPVEPSGTLYFQDVESYYQELGYTSGHTAGYAEGYEAGETHAYDTLQTGIAFETYGMYADAQITLVADRTEGSYYYMDLFDYVTDTNIERSVYVLYIQNASNSTWLGYVQDVNNSDSAGATYDIGSFSGASSTTDVVFTALMDRNLWEGAYITSFHGHAEAVNNAFWFTGGSYAATQQIYQDGYGEGYDVGRSDGYGLGYDAGVEVGRTQGMNEAEPESLTNTLVAVFQQPFNQLYRFFNFNILGLNVLGIVSGLISVLVVLKVFKKLYK